MCDGAINSLYSRVQFLSRPIFCAARTIAVATAPTVALNSMCLGLLHSRNPPLVSEVRSHRLTVTDRVPSSTRSHTVNCIRFAAFCFKLDHRQSFHFDTRGHRTGVHTPTAPQFYRIPLVLGGPRPPSTPNPACPTFLVGILLTASSHWATGACRSCRERPSAADGPHVLCVLRPHAAVASSHTIGHTRLVDIGIILRAPRER